MKTQTVIIVLIVIIAIAIVYVKVIQPALTNVASISKTTGTVNSITSALGLS